MEEMSNPNSEPPCTLEIVNLSKLTDGGHERQNINVVSDLSSLHIDSVVREVNELVSNMDIYSKRLSTMMQCGGTRYSDCVDPFLFSRGESTV